MVQNSFRNRLAHRISNFVFHYIADDEYEREVERHIDYGLRSARRDFLYHMDAPPTMTEMGLPEFDTWQRFEHQYASRNRVNAVDNRDKTE